MKNIYKHRQMTRDEKLSFALFHLCSVVFAIAVLYLVAKIIVAIVT